jgi:hypothetical protein
MIDAKKKPKENAEKIDFCSQFLGLFKNEN